MLFMLILPSMQCSDLHINAGIGNENIKHKDIEDASRYEEIQSLKKTNIYELDEEKNKEQESGKISDLDNTFANQKSLNTNNIDVEQKSYKKSTEYQEDKVVVEINNDYIIEKLQNDVDNIITKSNIIDNVVVYETEEFRKASDTLLLNINNEINDYNNSRKLYKENDNFTLIQTTVYKFLQFSCIYKQTLKHINGLQRKYLRAEIIHNMLIQEKNELEIFISLENSERIAHIDINEKECEINLLNLIVKKATKYEKNIMYTLSETIDEAWKSYDKAKLLRVENHLQYQTFALKQTINDIIDIADKTLDSVKNDILQGDCYEIIDDVCINLIYTIRDMDIYEVLKFSKYVEFLKDYEARIRQLLVCLCMGEKKSGEIETEKEIKEDFELNYEGNIDNKSNLHLDTGDYSEITQECVKNKYAMKDPIVSKIASSYVFANIKPIKRKIHKDDFVCDNAL